MLTGKLVRVRMVRNKLAAQYISTADPEWVNVAQRLLQLFRSLQGVTRDELEEEIRETIGENPTQLIHQGLAKLLEDRCDFEIQSDVPPDAIREKVFLAATKVRTENARSASSSGFIRTVILDQIGKELSLTPELLEQSLFADLKGEQRLTGFQDITVEQLLHRYNVALAQSVLLRATGVSILVTGETPTRYRQLFRAIKFHRLICEITSSGKDSYLIELDGPMSIFSSTQKYGMQLAQFLPSVLPCRHFELTARVRWGTKRVEKIFTLNHTQGLQSHRVDYGSYLPQEVETFAASFRKSIRDWELLDETAILPLGNHFWTPDFQLRHLETGKSIYLELFGYWRRTDIEQHLKRLRETAPVKFLLAVGQQLNLDEQESDSPKEIYHYRRTPIPAEVARMASELIQSR
jgi:predicted nuclease of restriction endonuclease-like RecB superfamily